jgi:rare lipoprotein A
MTIIRDIFLKTSLTLSLVLWLSFLINAQTIEVGYSQTGKASYYANQFHGKKTASGEKYDMYAMTAAHPVIPFNSIIKVTNTKNGKWVTLRVNDRGPFSKKRIVDVSKAAALMLDMVKDGTADVKLEVMRIGNEDSINSENNTPSIEEEKEEKKEEKVNKEEKKEKKEKKKKEKDVVKEDKKSNVVPEKSIKPVGTYSVFGVVKKAKGYGAQIATYGEVKKAIEEGKRAIKLGLKDVYIQAGYDKEKPVYRVIYGAKSSEKSAKSLVDEAKKKGFSESFTRKHF